MPHTSLSYGPVAGYLFVWCDEPGVCERLAEVAGECGLLAVETGAEGVHCFQANDISAFPDYVAAHLSVAEQRRLRVLFSDVEKPPLSAFAGVRSLEQFCQELSSRWLLDLLAEKRLKSLMQPIVTASESAKIIGYEFFLRGMQTDGTEIPAPVMFQAGGDAGALYMLDMAAGELASATACTFGIGEKVFINVMPSTLSEQDGIRAWLEAVAADSSLRPDQLVFELVESEFFRTVPELSDLVRRLHDEGIKLALDNFGTGFNNLAILTEVKPDYIKLDKSLQKGLIRDVRKWHMVANMIDAAKQNDIMIIAEGVEDEETASSLRSAGVDYLQGYLFGYPKEEPVDF